MTERGDRMRFVLALLAVLTLLAAPAFGDTNPPVLEREDAGCTKYEMCSAQTATGDCTVLPASGDEIVLHVHDRSQLTFYSLQSVGAHTCDFMTNDEGHDAASGVGFKFNTSSLTDAAPVLTFGGLFDYIWVTCPTIGTSVTVTALVCTSNR